MKNLLLLTIGHAFLLGIAGTALAESAAEKHEPRVYDCRVTYNGKNVGQAVVDTANAPLPSYVLAASGLTRNTDYTFGYIARSEEYTIGSQKTTEAGVLLVQGTFPVDEIKSLAGARFWVREKLPTSSGWINGFALGNYYGWFITRIACYYSTDGGVTWTESSHTGDITKGNSKRVYLEDLGVPEGAQVRIHAIVVGGKDRTGSEIFLCSYWPSGRDFSYRYAVYYIDGVTWNPVLDYIGTSDIR